MRTVRLISTESSLLPHLSSLFEPCQPGFSLIRSPAAVSNNLPVAKIKEHVSLRLTTPQWCAAPLSTCFFSKTLLWPPWYYTFLKFSYPLAMSASIPFSECSQALWRSLKTPSWALFGLKVPKDSTLSPILFYTLPLSKCTHSIDFKYHLNTSYSWISTYSPKLHSGFQTHVSNRLLDSIYMSHRDLYLVCPN